MEGQQITCSCSCLTGSALLYPSAHRQTLEYFGSPISA